MSDLDDSGFSIAFSHNAQDGKYKVELEITSYVKEIFLERLKLSLTLIESATADLSKDD